MAQTKVTAMSATLFLLATLTAASSSDPTIEQDPNGKQGWYSAPNYRGTLEIIWPCLLTVFLCCWNAIHLDIPHPRSTWQQCWTDRTACLLLGVLAPEIFINSAFWERCRAKAEFEHTVRVLGKENWSMTHGFYAGMGGFAVHLGSEAIAGDPDCTHAYVLEKSICHLFCTGQLRPDTWINKKDIDDKGKADSLVKALTVLQISWLLVQCCARLVQRLPLTTLEVGTLAYIPCAILTYYLWWDKPYEINTPTQLEVIDVLKTSSVNKVNEDPGFSGVGNEASSSEVRTISLRDSLGLITNTPNAFEGTYALTDIDMGSSSTKDALTARPSNGTERVAKLAPSVGEAGGFPAQHEMYSTYAISSALSHWEEGSTDPSTQVLILAVVFFVVGGVHLCAWNSSFATTGEQIAWKVCSILITTSIPVLCLLCIVLVWIEDTLRQKVRRQTRGRSSFLYNLSRQILEVWDKVEAVVIFIFLVLYVAARFYLIVECFVGLRAAPKAVYRTPEWTAFIPHVG
jgi:hypothetical protein